MREFIGTFLFCLIFCFIGTFFFAGLLLENPWALVTIIAFVLAVAITIYMKQVTRMEELEKKVEILLKHKEHDEE